MRVRFFYSTVVFFLLTTAVLPVALPTTRSVQLTDAEIARMNAEATAAGSQFRNLGVASKIASVAKAGARAVTNPFTTIYSLVAPLGMFAYGFAEQAFQSIRNTDYMGSTLSIMVDPKAQWNKLVKSQKEAVKKIAGLNATQAAGNTAVAAGAQASATTGPTVSELEASGWVAQYKAGPVGLVYDFGFAGAGDDLTQPFGFLRSVSTGKYYYRPVRGQMRPESMPIEGKSYSVDFRRRPFNILVPRLMLSLVGEKVAKPIWNTMLDFTQLDPLKIFVFKAVLLFSSSIKNSFKRVETKTSDVGQVYTKESWAGYRSVDKGSAYPTLANIHTELAKLVQRLKITPDIKRTIAANGGQTVPSKWDPAKIVYLGDINPGLILLSLLPDTLKDLLNALFKVSVNFYEFQLAIDVKNRLRPSDIEILYGYVRSYGSSSEARGKMQAAARDGGYVDEYILQLQELQARISTIPWKGGAQSFTCMIKLFFLLRWMLKDVYTGIEYIVSKYEQPDSAMEREQVVDASTSSDLVRTEDVGLQDQSIAPEAVLSSVYSRSVDYELLTEKVLKERVVALKEFALFVRKYVDSFIAQGIGDSAIDARYLRATPKEDLSSFEVQLGGADDLRTYFSPDMMKKTLKDYAVSVGKEADAIGVTIDAEIESLGTFIARAANADSALKAAQASGITPSPTLVDAMVDTADDFISELRKRVNANQEFGVYPLGYDERYLKTVELPGAVYLAYCLNYQARLLSRPFEGDALHVYDDSFYDNDSSYLYFLSVLMRANEDLSRAGAVVSAINGPVEFKDGDGKPYTVPNGAEFYLNGLKKYDQFALLKEQDLRTVERQKGKSSPEYTAALTAYSNARKLLIQKKFEMNNLLRTFEFDRRKGALYTPPLNVTSTQALALANKSMNELLAAGDPNSRVVSPAVRKRPVGSMVHDASLDDKLGIVGRFDNGSPIYSYERSVASFLQAEIARFAFRSNMLRLDDLKELVFAVTGIQAEDLWTGVEAKKRDMFFAQQASAAAARPISVEGPLSGRGSLDELLAGSGDEKDPVAGDDWVEGEAISGFDDHRGQSESGTFLSQSSSRAEVESFWKDKPLPVVSAGARLAPLLTTRDLEALVVEARAKGEMPVPDPKTEMFVPYMNELMSELGWSEGQNFGMFTKSQDGNGFSESLKKFVGFSARVPAEYRFVMPIFLRGAQLNFIMDEKQAPGGGGFSDLNAAKNMLLVTDFLRKDILANIGSEYIAELDSMIDQLDGWLSVYAGRPSARAGDGESSSGSGDARVVAAVLPPIPPLEVSVPQPAAAIDIRLPQGLTKRAANLIQAIDLDQVKFEAVAQGRSSFNDAAGIAALNGKLADLFAQGQAAAAAEDGQMFTAYVVKVFALLAQALDPSDDVNLVFVSALSQMMSLLAFNGEAAKLADINSIDNVLEVVSYLKGGALVSQARALSLMEEQLASWLRSH